MPPKASPNSKKPDQSLALARIKHKTYAIFLDRVFLTIRTGIKAGAGYLIAHAGHDAIEKIANGKIEWGSIAVAVVNGDAKNLLFVGVSVTLSGVIVWQHHSKKKMIEKHGELFKQLEEGVDPRRSSSKLLADGGTRKEDRT